MRDARGTDGLDPRQNRESAAGPIQVCPARQQLQGADMTPWAHAFSLASRALAVVCLWAIATTSLAQEVVTELRPHWEPASQVNYLLTKTGTKRGVTITTRTNVQLRVTEATEEGYLLLATFGETRFDDPQIQSDRLVRELGSILQGVDIELVVDRNGAVQRVRNWEVVKTSLGKAIRVMVARLQQDGAPKALTAQVDAQVTRAFSSEPSIRSAVMRELHLLFVPLGHSYSSTAPFEYLTELPVLMGNGTVQAKGTFELTALDANGLATLRWTQTADPQSLAKVTAEAIAQMGASEADRAVAPTSMTLTDTGEFVVDTHSGWPVTLTHTRKVESGPSTKTDTTSFQAQ